jgi:phospholipase C
MTAAAGSSAFLPGINHFVVVMLENRSFDQMLGFLYAAQGNVSPLGQPFEGLTGKESNPDATGKPAPVFQILPTDPHPYFMPGANAGEGYSVDHMPAISQRATVATKRPQTRLTSIPPR